MFRSGEEIELVLPALDQHAYFNATAISTIRNGILHSNQTNDTYLSCAYWYTTVHTHTHAHTRTHNTHAHIPHTHT